MIRIHLVDDHDLFRAGVRSILQQQEGLVVLGEFANGEDAVQAVRNDPPDLVLMDIRLEGGMDGIETAAIGETSRSP